MLGNYQVAAQLVASRVVLSSTRLVSYFNRRVNTNPVALTPQVNYTD
jgi:hypothetical protein